MKNNPFSLNGKYNLNLSFVSRLQYLLKFELTTKKTCLCKCFHLSYEYIFKYVIILNWLLKPRVNVLLDSICCMTERTCYFEYRIRFTLKIYRHLTRFTSSWRYIAQWLTWKFRISSNSASKSTFEILHGRQTYILFIKLV